MWGKGMRDVCDRVVCHEVACVRELGVKELRVCDKVVCERRGDEEKERRREGEKEKRTEGHNRKTRAPHNDAGKKPAADILKSCYMSEAILVARNKCHTCHTKRRCDGRASAPAEPAQCHKLDARHTKAQPVSRSATPAKQNGGRWRQMPHQSQRHGRPSVPPEPAQCTKCLACHTE